MVEEISLLCMRVGPQLGHYGGLRVSLCWETGKGYSAKPTTIHKKKYGHT